MANGRVATGFSKPYVAKYASSNGTVTYSDGQVLARGVSVSLSPETGDDNIFYADNTSAETIGGVFNGGTVTLEVDGLKTDAEKLIMGLPTADTDGWMNYGDDQSVPYMGIGYIVRYMSEGVTSYVPTVLAKCVFSPIADSATTQSENIDFQTQSLEASVFRGDDSNHNWKYVGKEYATEALAETALKKKLSIS